MAIPVLESVKAIEQQYRTGEEPVLVTCSDNRLWKGCLRNGTYLAK